MEGRTSVEVCLPRIAEDDPLFSIKKMLFDARKHILTFQVPVPSSQGELHQLLDQMLKTARILCLNEVEAYFLEDASYGPFSPRNELESLNSILSVVRTILASEADTKKLLQALLETIPTRVKSIGDLYIDDMVSKNSDTSMEELLLEWGNAHGARIKLNIAYFERAGRGAVALEDIDIGDAALEIPESIIISEDLIYGSDMFDILKQLDDISIETMLLFWSMRERYNSNSKFKIYFENLPEEFRTGLSFGTDALCVLEGTLLFEELLQAKEHLHQQYDALCPMLCYEFPEVFPSELYTWEKFLWACELWYSNSMKVAFADGKLRTCLVPIAGFLNHSVSPHILNYGRVDPATKCLKFPLSRPCRRGEQCYLSYGNFPNAHLIAFYGFLVKGNNTYDVIPIDIDASHAGEDGHLVQAGETSWTTHMVRGTWISNNHQPPTYGLPHPLLAHLRAVLDSDSIEQDSGAYKEKDRAVFETIHSIFSPMMEGLDIGDNFNCENLSWDMKLALEYKDIQGRIISSVLDSCAAGLAK